jgi:tRNA modification GTPase
VESLTQVHASLQAAGHFLTHGPLELAAEQLRQAQMELGEIVGESSNEDLLDRIFSSFCIGK